MDKIVRKHSRLLDVYLWSEHQGLSYLCDELWEENFKHDQLNNTNSTKYKKMFKLVVLNLYVVWLEDKTLAVGLSMSPNEYKQGSRYSQLFISRKIIPIVRKMHKKGLIDLLRGSEQSGKTTRIRAADDFKPCFKQLNLCPMFDLAPNFLDRNFIILQETIKVNGKVKKKIRHEYDDTDATVAMQNQMFKYNALLNQTHIDIPTLKEPVILHKGNRIQVNHLKKVVERIFYRGSFDYGGRLHGGFWQEVGSEWRSKIYMNGGATVEVDFSSYHIAMLYGLMGIKDLPKDCYTLGNFSLEGYTKKNMRDLVKALALRLINADSEEAVINSLHMSYKTKSESLTKNDIKQVIKAFKEQHTPIQEYFCSDVGVKLMKLDGEICCQIVNEFTLRERPILSVHDSFIVHLEDTLLLKEQMDKAVSDVIGCKIAMTQDFIGLDEISVDDDIKANITPPKEITKEYKERLRKHEKWLLSFGSLLQTNKVQPSLLKTLELSVHEENRRSSSKSA